VYFRLIEDMHGQADRAWLVNILSLLTRVGVFEVVMAAINSRGLAFSPVDGGMVLLPSIARASLLVGGTPPGPGGTLANKRHAGGRLRAPQSSRQWGVGPRSRFIGAVG
jgi:hypothetical protein